MQVYGNTAEERAMLASAQNLLRKHLPMIWKEIVAAEERRSTDHVVLIMLLINPRKPAQHEFRVNVAPLAEFLRDFPKDEQRMTEDIGFVRRSGIAAILAVTWNLDDVVPFVVRLDLLGRLVES